MLRGTVTDRRRSTYIPDAQPEISKCWVTDTLPTVRTDTRVANRSYVLNPLDMQGASTAPSERTPLRSKLSLTRAAAMDNLSALELLDSACVRSS